MKSLLLPAIFFVFCFFPALLISQENQGIIKSRFVFYNLENLFDTRDDPLTNDDEFTPEGARHWTSTRLYSKLNNISKTFYAIGETGLPAVIGVCEIENRYVLNKLVFDTPLKKSHYNIIHKDSPDRRGIDVAMLYQEKSFSIASYRYIQVSNSEDTSLRTREILYAKGVLNMADTCHILVNHWPSRSGGINQTEPKRKAAALVVRSIVDSLFAADPASKIIIMGDFNDEPDDASISEVLHAVDDTTQIRDGILFNMMGRFEGSAVTGTHKYQEEWSVFDQVIVSGGLFHPENVLYSCTGCAGIFMADFLLTDDENNFGKKPLRTYVGMKWEGGFSDHLPVFIDIYTIR